MSSVGGSGDGNGDKNKKGKQGSGDKSLGSGSTEKLPLKSTSKTASPAPACEQRSTSDTQPRKKMSGSAGDSQRSGPGSYLPPPAPPPVQHNQRLVPGQGYLPSGLQPVYATSPPVNMQMMPPGQSAGHGRGQSTHPPPPMLQQGQLPAQQPVWMSQSAVPQPVYATKAQMLQLGQRAGGQSGASAPMPTNPQTLLPHIGDNPHVEHGFQVRVELESRASSRDPPKVRLPNQPELSPTKTTQAVQRTPAQGTIQKQPNIVPAVPNSNSLFGKKGQQGKGTAAPTVPPPTKETPTRKSSNESASKKASGDAPPAAKSSIEEPSNSASKKASKDEPSKPWSKKSSEDEVSKVAGKHPLRAGSQYSNKGKARADEQEPVIVGPDMAREPVIVGPDMPRRRVTESTGPGNYSSQPTYVQNPMLPRPWTPTYQGLPDAPQITATSQMPYQPPPVPAALQLQQAVEVGSGVPTGLEALMQWGPTENERRNLEAQTGAMSRKYAAADAQRKAAAAFEEFQRQKTINEQQLRADQDWASQSWQRVEAREKADINREVLKKVVEEHRLRKIPYLFPYPWAPQNPEGKTVGIPMWSYRSTSPQSFSETAKLSHSELLKALNQTEMLDAQDTQEDRESVKSMMNDNHHKARAAALANYHEVYDFCIRRDAPLGLPGLIVHAQDRNHEHYRLTSTAIFVRTYSELLRSRNDVPLTYIAARRKFHTTYGLMRSLCTQLLVAYPTIPLPFVDPQYLSALSRGGTAALCVLFRDLVCDIADDFARRKNPKEKKVHTVVIDGLDLLESDQQSLSYVVDFFRLLSDEAQFGHLKDYFVFKYALIHPKTSFMLESRPYGSEAHVWIPPTL